MNTKQTQSVRQSRSGFTLIELLMAMFILSLGLAAISSLFPVSALIQRRSFDEQMARLIKDNTTALITAHKFESAGLPNSSKVEPATTDKDYFRTYLNPESKRKESGDWPLSMRCFPMHNDNRPIDERDYYWVPLFRKHNGSHQVFVFILRKQAGISYGIKKNDSANKWAVQEFNPALSGNTDFDIKIPGVKKAKASSAVTGNTTKITIDATSKLDVFPFGNESSSGFIQIGDQILTSTGKIVIVKEIVNENNDNKIIVEGRYTGIDAIWYGRPPQAGMEAVTLRIFVIGQEAIK